MLDFTEKWVALLIWSTSVLYSSRRVKLAATAKTMMRTQVARVMPQERCC